MTCLIKLFKVYIRLTYVHCIHTASDIYSNYIWNCFIYYSHSSTNSASLTGMNIWHYSDLATFCKIIIAHTTDLFDGSVLNYSGVAYSSINFSLYLEHYVVLQTNIPNFLLCDKMPVYRTINQKPLTPFDRISGIISFLQSQKVSII